MDGSKGERGSQGFGGVQGPKGDKGPAGAQGTKGDLGPVGNSGTNGTDGAKGQKGTSGTNGRPGETGSKGEAGTPGLNGAKGEKGETPSQSVTARAVAYFDGTSASIGGEISPISNHGFSRIDKVANGRYKLTFAKPLPSANFVLICQATDPDGELRDPFVTLRSTRAVTVDTREITGSHTPVDSKIVNILIFHP